MKKLQLLFFIGFAMLLSGCACDCDDDAGMLQLELKNFSPQELTTVYLVSEGRQDTCFTCINTQGQGVLFVVPNTQYQIKSDSIPLNKVVQITKIRSETLNGPCKCTKINGIDYELDGDKYSDELIVITR